ncbi:beta-propeller fold lactonase family protein [Luteococcus sp. H138]|uniref:lactonase family protein n=1 Tax=unclassified Luteococcus TaxID=2639923 RepID=UPI00313F0C1F
MTQIASTTCAADGTITTFTLDGETLAPLATSQIGKGVSAMAIDASERRAHVSLKEPTGVATLSLDPASGEWAQTAQRPLETHPSYLRVTADGRYLLGADYGAGAGMVWPLTDGVLGEPTAAIEHQRLHSVLEIDGYCYFVSLGEDLVACYRLTDDGRLDPLSTPTVAAPAGSGPRHVIASGNGRNLYVVTEFTGEVLRYARDPHTGVLALQQRVVAHATDRGLKPSVIDEDPIQNHYVWGADLHLAGPEGRWLVVSERTESTLAVLPVADNGTLAEPVCLIEAEQQPRGFCVTPDGNHVLCPGEKSDQVSLFRLEDDGQLVRVAQAPNGKGANWARVVSD